MSRLITYFRKLGYIDNSNDKIIEFGLHRLNHMILDLLFTFVCAWIMGNPFTGLLFEIAYTLIRVYAGGYHAATERLCMYLTYFSTLLSILLIFFLPVPIFIMHLMLLIISMVIIILSPVESANKPLAPQEKKYYYHKCMGILLIEILLYLFLIWNHYTIYAKTICIALLLVAAGQLAEVISCTRNPGKDD